MILELYSKRLKNENEKNEDVYIYNDIPRKLRVQISHILRDAIGSDREAWSFIHNIMIKELGLLRVVGSFYSSEYEGCIKFLLEHENELEVLDIIELSFIVIDRVIKESDSRVMHLQEGRTQKAEDAINELNYRFKENSVGYEYVNGQIIKVDRKFTHNEIVKPAVKLLYEEEFEGASNEFLEAHKCYRSNDFKSAIHNSQKAFESTMKTICEKMGYEYNKDKDTANRLIGILCDNNLIPMELKTHFDGLKSLLSGAKASLEAGLPTLRNRKAGHGQGEDVVYVPQSLAIYAINLSATNIVLLVNLYRDIK